MSRLTFNGISKTYLKIARDWSLPGWAPIEREYLTVPQRAGGIPKRMQTGMRRFDIPIIIDSKTLIEKEAFVEDMAKWLIHEKAKPLVFSKYPNRTFFAEIEGAPVFSEMWMRGKGVISIVCSDPFKYGEERTVDFVDGAAIVNNEGSANAKPIYEFDVLGDLTHLDVYTDFAYIRAGEETPIDVPIYQQQTLLLNDSMKTLTGWTDVLNVDNGYVTGTMTATQTGFTPTSFGVEESPRNWQGPAKERTIPDGPVQNFQMRATVELLNVGKQTGMIEIYCMDVDGNTVIKVGIEDIMQSISEVQAKFQLGNIENRKVQNYRTADYKPAWNNYKGILRLFRSGNRIRPYFALVQPDGKYDWVSSNYVYTDDLGEYMAPISRIKVAIRKWPGTSEAVMKVRDLKVWRLNDPQEGVPIIASAEDKIVIDTNDSSIRLNGEERKDLKEFGASFFKLPPGSTAVLVQPFEKVVGKVRYKEPFR
ncbi:distal tail protein Dit [Planococcus halotolerans]|uniref:Phage tail family protein n=1 Tax=Planococcus halotolerans TaxID=2233542 RepID=A0A365KKR0_9BACL|nr:distal tail protein Dit [Planococcus halotolerans]RAZ73634.1 hypothetical protein DP120_17005 [Planococcus halotolerans]